MSNRFFTLPPMCFRVALLLALPLVCVGITPSAATPLLLTAVNVDLSGSPLVVSKVCGSGSTGTVGPVVATDGCGSSGSTTIPGTSLFISYQVSAGGQARADYGTLGVLAMANTAANGSATASFVLGSGSATAISVARMSDTIFFGAQDLTGAQAVAFQFRISGANDTMAVNGDTNPANTPVTRTLMGLFDSLTGNLIASSAGSVTYYVPLTGSAVPFSFELQGVAACGLSLAAGSMCGATAAWYDTAIIDSIKVVNADGNPLDLTFTTESGATYAPEAAVQTPEPSSLLLLGSGLLLVRRRRA